MGQLSTVRPMAHPRSVDARFHAADEHVGAGRGDASRAAQVLCGAEDRSRALAPLCQQSAADHCYRGWWRHVGGWRSGQARARDARRDVKMGSRVRGAGKKPWAAETLSMNSGFWGVVERSVTKPASDW